MEVVGTTREITILSFGHKFGKVPNAKIFDIRHLPGPTNKSKHLTGLSANLRDQLFGDEEFTNKYDEIKKEIQNDLINKVFAIGCEVGRHRSVTMVEQLKCDLEDMCVVAIHRDLEGNKKTKTQRRQKARDDKYSFTVIKNCDF